MSTIRKIWADSFMALLLAFVSTIAVSAQSQEVFLSLLSFGQ
jgi:hypothetical protein